LALLEPALIYGILLPARSYNMYKLLNDDITNEPIGVIHLTTKAQIPLDPANTDYQEYLEWIAEGNQPEEAD